jgi:hypothetical protein
MQGMNATPVTAVMRTAGTKSPRVVQEMRLRDATPNPRVVQEVRLRDAAENLDGTISMASVQTPGRKHRSSGPSAHHI